MKRLLVLIVLLVALVPLRPSVSQTVPAQNDASPARVEIATRGMPPRPIPARPIPHHEPGRPAKVAQYTSQVGQVNAQGVEQTTTLAGLDALLQDGVIADPLAGNRRLVNLDKIMFSSFVNYNDFAVRTFDITPTLDVIPGSQFSLGAQAFHDIAAGDLNGDFQAEQIAAWIDGSGHISWSIGEMPSLEPKVTSAPAALGLSALAFPGILAVRGYDDSLWYGTLYYYGGWGGWQNAGGRTLLSAPAVVYLDEYNAAVFAVGTDNLVYRLDWASGQTYGPWRLVDVPGYWPEVTWTTPTPEVDAPAAVARSAGQLDLFRRGPDNTLRWRHFDGAAWGNWQSLGGILTSAPAAIALGADGMQVFGRGLDGALWTRIFAGGRWGGWERLPLPTGITAASAPTVASPQAGQINVYMRGSDDALWQIQYSGGAWGDWASGGGVLGSGVGAAVWGWGQPLLFAQKTDGTLQYSSGVSDWADWDNLPARQEYGSDAVAVPPGDPASVENLLIDIDTGYFTGDGREQIVLAYQAPGNQIRVELYDAQNGFEPSKLAELDTPIAGNVPRVAAGDLDGDGVDEIVVAHLLPGDIYRYKITAYHIQRDGDGHWTLVAGKSSPTIYSYGYGVYALGEFWFAGTMRIAAGDLDGDLHDEIVVLSDWGNDWFTKYALWVELYIFDNDYAIDVGECRPGIDASCPLADQWQGYSMKVSWDHRYATGVGLAIGDVNSDSVDEIIVTWPTGFDNVDWPNLIRKLRILDARSVNAGNPYPTQLAEWVIPDYSGWSFLDTLAVSDLDRDLADEVAFYSYDQLSVYEYNRVTKTISQIAAKGLSTPNARSVNLVTGDFTGESLRVGTPSYRLQRATGDIIAILNEPPKHIDTLDGITYDINGTDAGTYAAYENEQSQSTEMSIRVQRDWGFAAGLETCIGDPEGTHVKNSLDGTYGEHFENTTTPFNQVDFGSEVKATSDDIVYYTGKDLQVWEYPVYEDNSRVPTGRIMVVFPLSGISHTGTQEFYETGNSSCDFWYAPEHQINNVWSYARFADQLRDFDPGKGVLNALQTVTVGPTEGEFWTRWISVTTTQQASSVSLGVDSMFERQIGGDSFEVSAEPFGIGVSYEVHLPYVKGTLKNSYSAGTLSTHTVVGSNDTTMRVHFNPVASSGIYNYEVTPYLYWAKGGYLVLDYLTNPKNTTFWNRYNRPDPAFILPWAGGQCAGKEQFSKDIVASPPFASNGETVIITATVHNFSNVGVDDVRVRFYLGEPGQNVPLGSEQSINLPARGKVDVSVPWQASGTGEQRIYAVIDPNHAIAEMHDETTNPENNNNVAFGVVAMGDSGFVDPGGQIYFDYQYLTYTDTHGLPTNVFIPSAAMTETLRVEVTPLAPTAMIRHGFRLVAYKGGTDRDSPWGLTFDPIPAAVWLRYSDADVAGLDENTLILYRYDSARRRWVDAACGEYQRHPEENWMLVPVCQTGDFGLLSLREVFLPLIMK